MPPRFRPARRAAIPALLVALVFVPAHGASAQDAPPPRQAALDSAALRHSVRQLRETIGRWNVVTEFLNEDGSVARRANGTYEFSWVVEDRVVAGRSAIPEMNQAAGILFYVSPQARTIEMVSVGPDGMLWVMTGPLGGETRTTQEYRPGTRLRFTRYNVEHDRFESRMEFTTDGGASWKPGNHQVFTRAGG